MSGISRRRFAGIDGRVKLSFPSAMVARASRSGKRTEIGFNPAAASGILLEQLGRVIIAEETWIQEMRVGVHKGCKVPRLRCRANRLQDQPHPGERDSVMILLIDPVMPGESPNSLHHARSGFLFSVLGRVDPS